MGNAIGDFCEPFCYIKSVVDMCKFYSINLFSLLSSNHFLLSTSSLPVLTKIKLNAYVVSNFLYVKFVLRVFRILSKICEIIRNPAIGFNNKSLQFTHNIVLIKYFNYGYFSERIPTFPHIQLSEYRWRNYVCERSDDFRLHIR